MEVIGSAVTEATQNYLHAGYISAYPRSLGHYNFGEPTLQFDVAQALQLKGEALASLSTWGDSWFASIAGTGDMSLLLGGTAAFFAALGLASLRPRKQSMAALSIAALLGLGAGACKTKVSEPPPWEAAALEEYQHPEDATKVLLYGLIADGLASGEGRVDALADIQHEVGFPTTKPTRGMSYALSSYGIDGWGKEFRFKSHGESFEVTSAGADGRFDTPDDLSLAVRRATNSDWEQQRWAFYLDNSSEDPQLFFHRFSGKHFQYGHHDEAVVATGTELFDL
ncbi:MAG: hypothetical protein HN348_36525, partial [Proteobacteria bacterium]|nr:hypothetical protein [Pseudomonadota bacterium]